jgi:uncharacterized protein
MATALCLFYCPLPFALCLFYCPLPMLPRLTTIPLLQLASGDRLSLQVYQFTGSQPGKKVYIQSNLHGAEIAGNAVIAELIQWLGTLEPEQLTGEIWLLPVCNPIGVNQRSHFFSAGRFNPYDGRDWNRIFWDYEKTDVDVMAFAQQHLEDDRDTIQRNYRQTIQSSFAQLSEKFARPSHAPFWEQYRVQLQSLCLDADYVLDLHTSAGHCIDYLYYFQRREAGAQLFLLPIGILLDDYDGDAFDEAFIKPWLALEACFAQLGRSIHFEIEAYTLELGSSMQLNPTSVTNGVRGIKHYVIQKGLIVDPTFADSTSGSATNPILASRRHVKKYYAPAGGMIQPRVSLGNWVESGQCLYQLLSFNKEGKLPSQQEICAERSGIVFDVAINQAVNQGEYVLEVLETAIETDRQPVT